MQKTTDIGTEVTVTQTESRAILSWETFNIGRETTLVFDQKRDGTAQTDWVALNRVVGQLDPATGRRDASKAPAPSQILGLIKRSEEHTSELQSLMRISYAVFCLKKKKN